MKMLDAIVAAFLLTLLATGAYGLWHSTTAEEFTAREALTGRAKYRYRPTKHQRVLHFVKAQFS